MAEGWGEGFWKVCVTVCSRYSVFLALGLWHSWKEGQCEPVSASQEGCFPVAVVADFWKYDVTPNVILKIDVSLLLPCFVQFVSCHLKGYNE